MFFLFALAGCSKETVYDYVNTNVLIKNMPDPFVFKAEDRKYYAIGTTEPAGGFKIYSSDNLLQWTAGGYAFIGNFKTQAGDFWAPEVVQYSGKYYLFYSARQFSTNSLRIYQAVSDTPEGPYLATRDEPFFDFGYAAIDADVLIDGDKIYLYFSRDCSENIVDGKHTSQIYVVELKDDLSGTIGEAKLLTTPDAPWELKSGDYVWNEGPAVFKQGNIYFLMYSAGYYGDSTYSIGYATSSSPLGPFAKYKNNPIVQSDLMKGFSGPGHNTVLMDGEDLYIAYHIHANINGGADRNMVMNHLYIQNNKLVVGPPVK